MNETELVLKPTSDLRRVLHMGSANKSFRTGERLWLKSFVGLIVTIAVFTLANVQAANWFVRPSAAGTGSGKDWNNAWSLGGISWSSVSPGDTIYVAGGSHGNFTSGKSGASGSQITVVRASANTAACTSAAGWSSAFDSQIILGSFTINNSYVTLSGLTPSGILINISGGSGQGGSVCQGPGLSSSGAKVAYIEFAGPSSTESYGLWISYGGSNPASVNNLTVDHCIFHGLVNGMQLYGSSGLTVQYCEFYNINNGTDGTHGNVVYMNADQSGNVWRFNKIHDNNAMGIAYEDGANCISNVFYGNWFYNDGGVQNAIATDHNGDTVTSLYVYNNTFVNEPVSVNLAYSAGAGAFENNIYWNSGQPQGIGNASSDYNFSDSTISGESHSISGGSNPFASLTGLDFHIISTIASSYPRNKGAALSSAFNTDMDGNVRGADGSWDIGALEYGSGITTNPVIVVSPSALSFGPVAAGASATNTFTVQNSGTGTLAGTATVPSAYSSFLTILSGGTYSLGAGQSQTVTVRYTSTGAATDTGSINCSGGSGYQISVVGTLLTALQGLSFPSTAGNITAPFTASSGYISQSVDVSNSGQAGVASGGQAVYNFNISTAGLYTVSASVNAPSESSKSFWVNMDGQPTDPTMIWDVYPYTVGFENRTVSWRGSNTFTNDQYSPQIFSLSAGAHQLIIVGREANVQLGQITISGMTPPPPPLNLHVLAGP